MGTEQKSILKRIYSPHMKNCPYKRNTRANYSHDRIQQKLFNTKLKEHENKIEVIKTQEFVHNSNASGTTRYTS
jgi:hypothetical protein